MDLGVRKTVSLLEQNLVALSQHYHAAKITGLLKCTEPTVGA
jgi:hypothetical protein